MNNSTLNAHNSVSVLSQAMDQNPSAIIIINKNLIIEYVNPAFRKLTGYKQKEALGSTVGLIIPTLSDKDPNHELWEGVADGYVWEGEVCDKNKNGEEFCTQTAISAIKNDAGEVTHFVITKTDITKQKRTVEELRTKEYEYQQLVDNSISAMYILQDGVFVYVNQQFVRLSGYTPDEIVGKMTPGDIVSPEHMDEVKSDMFKRLHGDTTHKMVLYRARRKNGSIAFVKIAGMPIKHNGKDAIMGTAVDITDHIETEERLRVSEIKYKNLAIVDDLTGLFNQRYFQSQVEQEVNKVRRFAHFFSIAIFDIDNFKKVNDTYGHIDGDRALVLFGEVIRDSLTRKTDTAYRYGGEEFIVILPMTRSIEASLVAERIRKNFNEKTILIRDNVSIQLSVSAGVAEYRPGEAVSDFIRRADAFMYEAKHSGKNRVCHEITS